jgi:glutamyl/glutaminyl-tRNA synthetase
MRISHVIRGEEWLSSTPKHIWLYQCFGWQTPKWVHLPLILNADRSKLSKRMNDVSVESYLEKGYLPEALLNFVALLGWHSADDREIYNLEELADAFSLDRVNKAGAIFDLSKLDWMNGHYLRSLPLRSIAERARKLLYQSASYVMKSNTWPSSKRLANAVLCCLNWPNMLALSFALKLLQKPSPWTKKHR